MALELKIAVNSYDRENHILTVDDTTGAYNNPSNLGGYGAPNPERNAFALVLSSVRISGQETVQWGSDPLTDTSIDFQYISDQIANVYLCAIDFESGALDVQSLATGYLFYYVDEDIVYVVVERNGVKSLETTSDVVSNSLHASVALTYLVKSYAEEKKRNFFCEDINSCCEKLSTEYEDISKALEVMECYFEENNYIRGDEVALFSGRINKNAV